MKRSFTKSKLSLVAMIAFSGIFIQRASSQVSFNTVSAGLQTISGFSYGDCGADMNGDGLDDIVRVTDAGLYIDYQQPNGSFVGAYFTMTVSNLPSWSICAADIDDNGYCDLLLGSGNGVSFVYANDDGTAYTEDSQPEYIFTQRSTFADIDNDGNLDAFACHDVAQCRPYRNVNGVLSFDASLITTLAIGGNYAAIWVDYDNDWDSDLYITKCRGGAAVGDPQRINLLYRNDGGGVFTSVGPEANMDDGDQSWATVFEDFDNDGDFDSFTVNHETANRLMRNNGDGTFTNIIAGSGINASDLGAWNCDAGDFDNNGFVDIFSEMTNEMHWNNGDGTFSASQLGFDSGGIGDYNNDGFLDVVAGNNIYMNNGNTNNWFKVDLEGIASNKDGIGARIEIYGDWGIQIREVRAGESFDPASSLISHFGLGTANAIDQVVVKWPSGMITTINNPDINQTIEIPEVGCMLDPVAIVANGPTSICPNDQVTITAPAGNSYLWSNGSTTQSITVSQAGSYSVLVYYPEDCASISNTIVVEIITSDLPAVTVTGDDIFCQDSPPVLTASTADSYLWSNGQTTQTIVADASGEYYVTVTGACSGVEYQSESIMLSMLAAPAPAANDVTIGAPGTAEITATGSNLEWFATANSTDVIATGSPFTTGNITGQTSYWVQSTYVFGGEVQNGGKLNNEGTGGLPSSGGKLIFNVTEAFTLEQATIYLDEANLLSVEGERTIQLFDMGANLLMETTVNILFGANVVDINFFIQPGDGYQIGIAENNVFRNSGGVVYPYPVGDVASITTSTFGASYYYYLYNWQIKKEEISCTSERTEVMVSIVGVEEVTNPFGVKIYPNPTSEMLNLTFAKSLKNVVLEVSDSYGQKVIRNRYTQGNLNQLTLEVGNLAPGLYHVSISDGVKISSLEFVKQ
jgi:hypothetical protein